MRMYRSYIEVSTSGHGQMVDLTARITEEIKRSDIQQGLIHLFAVGSTVALGTIEFEPGLLKDLPALMDELAPPDRRYHHDATWHDGNGHSHLQATLLGATLTLPLEGGQPVLGTWQQVFLLECDIRPRRRRVVATIIGQ